MRMAVVAMRRSGRAISQNVLICHRFIHSLILSKLVQFSLRDCRGSQEQALQPRALGLSLLDRQDNHLNALGGEVQGQPDCYATAYDLVNTPNRVRWRLPSGASSI